MSAHRPIPELSSGTYRHNKSGKLYEVLGVALETESDEPVVVYRPLYAHEFGFEFFTRPYEMFIETVELNGRACPRFEKIDS